MITRNGTLDDALGHAVELTHELTRIPRGLDAEVQRLVAEAYEHAVKARRAIERAIERDDKAHPEDA